MARTAHDFRTIRSEGALLPPGLLRRVVDPKAALPGTKPEDYGLPPGERLNEVITQSWNRLRRHWADFRSAAKNLPPGEPGTGPTNDKWSLPLLRELGFGLLPASAGPEADGRSYPISRFYGTTAVHLVGCNLILDRRAAGVRGSAAANPHVLVQEFLNHSDKHMWAILSNGLQLRILRDNRALSRQSFLEFDLESMLAGEVYSDFVVLWLMVHATRFAPLDGDKPESCWLEQWTKIAEEQGTRALGDLRAGVENALQALGQGLVGHPKNTSLRESLSSGRLSLGAFHGELLRVVYRLIFLLIAEDRTIDGLPFLHPRDDSDAARKARSRYLDHYSVARLRELASKIRGSRHGDLWHQFNLLVGALSGDCRFDAARQQLALPVLGGFLWSPSSTANLNASNLGEHGGSELTNADFLEAIRNLAFTRKGKTLRPVDYKNLGSEELGGVYESLLALTPQISGDGAKFTFAEFSGNERKTSGSYYTPDSLVQCLLDSALDPVVADAVKGKAGADAESAILNLRVCDPACGSGHFLVGAAHRLAHHLARARAHSQGQSEPSPLMYQHALREVIRRCVYGVDLNPMAVELCKVSLWMETMEPGKPLTFLDAHIKCGNSLLGTTPKLMEAGIPDDAFEPLTGDDKKVATYYKTRNKQERRDLAQGKGTTLEDRQERLETKPRDAPAMRAAIKTETGIDAQVLRTHDQRRAATVLGTACESAKLLADAWCAAFVWKKHDTDAPGAIRGFPGEWDAITEQIYREIERNTDSVQPWIKDEIRRLASEYSFFHWHLEFPEVFGWQGSPPIQGTSDPGDALKRAADAKSGFDCVIGNPPFLNQLESGTSTAKGLSAIVEARSDHAIRGYTDLSATFLLFSTQIVRERGRVALVQPQSLLAVKDAEPVRAAVLQAGSLEALWVSNQHVFDGASVFTCAPTIKIGGERVSSLARSTGAAFSPLPPMTLDNDALARAETWAHLAAAASGVPEILLRAEKTISTLADATADFRDQYYGLDGFLLESESIAPVKRGDLRAFPPIVTTGLIDLAECRWGHASTRILKTKWQAPRIDRVRMESDGTLGPWIRARLIPKILLATQTRIIEVFVDADGRYVPSTPLITVAPKHPEHLWRVAAAIASPVCSVLAMQKYAGAAMTADAIKLSAKQVLGMPVPSDVQAWSDGAAALADAHTCEGPAIRSLLLNRFGVLMCRAYNISRAESYTVMEWWSGRLRSEHSAAGDRA